MQNIWQFKSLCPCQKSPTPYGVGDFCLVELDLNNLIATRTSTAADGWTEANLNFLSANVQIENANKSLCPFYLQHFPVFDREKGGTSGHTGVNNESLRGVFSLWEHPLIIHGKPTNSGSDPRSHHNPKAFQNGSCCSDRLLLSFHPHNRS